MKKVYFSLLTFLCFSYNISAQNCFWAKQEGGAANENGRSVALDAAGNVYSIGFFSGSSLTLGSTTLTNSYPGVDAYYLLKQDAAGNIIWAKGAVGIAQAYGIAVDPTGNILVTGYFDGPSTTFGTLTLNNMGAGDAFVLKYDPSGNVLWENTIAGAQNIEYGKSVTTDANGSVYVTGFFNSDSVVTSVGTLYNHSTSIYSEYFIAKYSAAGVFLWAQGNGGNRGDEGTAIKADTAGNIIVTGTFRSDSIAFGSTVLHNSASGATSMFMVKYDSLGNIAWAKAKESFWGDVYSGAIETNGTDIYIGGEFSGVSLVFGTDSLVNSSGYLDVFLTKYDLNGNPVWAAGGGSTNEDNLKSITVDASGNVYATGYFMGYAFRIGMDSVFNHSGGIGDIFITKFNSSGALQWIQGLGGPGFDQACGIATKTGNDIYFTGSTEGAMQLGSTTFNSTSQDIFIADMFSLSSGISASTNVTCFGAADGTATAFATGGHPSLTYTWNTSPVQTGPVAGNLPGGNYTVTVTEGYGCAQTSTVLITEPAADSAKICMVTVDSISQHNIIIWDKTSFTTVDSFIVYREIATNNYQPIGVVAYDSLSEFVDTTRTHYFPNTGDPNAGTYRYKLQAKSSCGTSGPLSPYHNTIYITNSGGTFTWSQLYSIESGLNPVSSYVLMRDDSTTGNWHAVASVAGTQQTVSDPMFATYQNTASWRVETVWSISCTPTRSINRSLSNVFTNHLISVKEEKMEKMISLFPNPSSGNMIIDFNSAKDLRVHVEIINILGEHIFSNDYHNQEKVELGLSGFAKGIYSVTFKTDEETFTRKIVLN